MASNKQKLQADLIALGVEYPAKATIKDLEKLLKKAQKAAVSPLGASQATGADAVASEQVDDAEDANAKYKGKAIGHTTILAAREYPLNGRLYKHLTLADGTTQLLSQTDLDKQIQINEKETGDRDK